MNSNHYQGEVIEAYLNNELPASERVAFEEALNSDPLLQQEVALQEEIMSSLKQYRKMQLKSRLNNIDLSAGSYVNNTVSWWWYASAAFLVGIASIFTWQYKGTIFSEKSAPIAKVQPVIEKAQDSSVNSTITTIAPVIEERPATVQEIESVTKKEPLSNTIAPKATKRDREVKPATSLKTATDSKSVIKSSKAVPVTIVDHNFDISLPDAGIKNSSIKKDETLTIPSGSINNESVTADARPQIDIKFLKDKEYSHHYQYYNNKLFLYGDFDSEPYELLEINSADGKKLYMYHKGAYYHIKNNVITINPLSKITDSLTIEELNLIRN